MKQEQIPFMLSAIGAIITDSHLVYTSGRHGSAYVNKDAIYPHTEFTSDLCRIIAEQLPEDGIEVVVAPAVGGVILSQWVAFHLSKLTGRQVLGLYAEKSESGDAFVIKRGYDRMIPGRRVLLVEDVLTTGGSIKKVGEVVRTLKGNIIGVAAICNRGAVTVEDLGGVPKLSAIMNVTLDSWSEEECPLCAQGVPINTDVGKGREFLARKATTAK